MGALTESLLLATAKIFFSGKNSIESLMTKKLLLKLHEVLSVE